MAIDAGARYEIQYPAGTSHFLEKLAFAVSDDAMGIVFILSVIIASP